MVKGWKPVSLQNAVYLRLSKLAKTRGLGFSETIDYLLHFPNNAKSSSNTVIDPTVRLGKNVKVSHGAVIEELCEIGDNCFIGYYAILKKGTKIGNNSVFSHLSVSEGKNSIGNFVTIHSQCHITTGAKIEDRVFIAPEFVGANTSKISHGRKYDPVYKPYTIGYGTRIAINVTLLPGVHIGRECLIGAGAVVTKNVPDYSIVYGNPARVIGRVPNEELLSTLNT